MSVGIMVCREKASAPFVLEKFKIDYSNDRLEDQIDHYQTYDPKKRHWWHGCANVTGSAASILAIGFVLNTLIHKVSLAQDPHASHDLPTLPQALLYFFLPIALPLAAGVVASLQFVTDSKRRAQVYPEMVERLEYAKAFLPSLRTVASLRRFVQQTEEVLLDELVGWYAAAKGISH
jgi:hypothetical protein